MKKKEKIRHQGNSRYAFSEYLLHRYRTLFEGAGDAIFLMDSVKFLECNGKTLEIFGCKKMSDIVGSSPLDFSPAEQPGGRLSADAADEVIRKTLKGNEQHFYWKHKKLDGSLFDAEVSLTRLQFGEEVYIQAIVRDITEKMEVARALEASEERYRSVVSSLAEGVMLYDSKGNFITCNDSALEILGYSYNDLAGTNISSFENKTWDENGKALSFEKYPVMTTLRTGKSVDNFVMAVQRADGSKVWISVNSRPLEYSMQNIAGTVVTSLTDITGLKQVTEDLRKEKNLLERVVESVPGIFYQFDEELKLHRWNREYRDLIGYSDEEMLRGRIIDFIPDEDHGILAEAIDKARRTGFASAEVRIRKKDGSLVPIIATGGSIEMEGRKHIVGVAVDISERLAAEKALRRSEEKFVKVFRSAPDPYLITTLPEGRIVEANEAFFSLSGYSARESVGKTTTELNFWLEGKLRDEFLDILQRDRRIKNFEATFRNKSGRYSTNLLSSEIIILGEVPHLITILRDITLKRRSENAIRSISEGVAGVTGQEFFTGLVRILSESLHLYGVFVGEFSPGMDRVETIAVFENDQITDNFCYLLENTPCRRIAEEELCIHPDRVAEIFELDTDLKMKKIRSYAGIVLKDSSDKQMGLLVLYGREPMADTEFIRTILQLSSIRASAEMERMRNEATLVESEIRFRQLAENIDEVFMVTNADWSEILYLNPAYEKIWRQPAEKLMKEPLSWMDPVDPADREILQAEIKKRIDGDFSEVNIPEFRIHNEDGERWMAGKIFPVYDEEGRLIRIIGIAQDVTERRKNMIEIQKYQRSLQSMVSELNLAEEKERKRIAINLHDQLGQILAMAKIRLSSLHRDQLDAEGASALEDAESHLNKAIQDSRTLTYELSPPVLYELGLVPALRWKLDQLSEQSGIKTGIEAEKAIPPLGDDLQILLFRTVSELLNNIVKHASASQVMLSVRSAGKGITIHLSDDGVGFDPSILTELAAGKQGFGIFSIRERLGYFGGHLLIETMPGKGTSAEIFLPLSP